mgnify:CR=1 FL=1
MFPRNNDDDDDDKNLGNSIKNNPNRLIRYDSAQLNKDYSNENFQIFFPYCFLTRLCSLIELPVIGK